MSEPIKLSASSIGTYSTCPRRYWYHKLSGLESRDTTSSALDRGSLFHVGMAAALRQTNPKLNLKVAIEAIGALYVAGTGSVTERDEAVEMVKYFAEDIGINVRNFAYKINGVPAVELEFDENFGDFNLRGSIDAVIRDTDGRTFLLDWKTRKRHYEDIVVQNDKQLAIYAAILKREGIELDGALQIQLSAPPQPLKFKVDSDISLASSLNERSAKTTQAMFDESIAHMSASERLLAQMKLGNKVAPDTDFKKLSFIDLNDVDTMFETVLKWGHRIAQEKEFLPVMDSWVCGSCSFLTECRASLKGKKVD